MPSSRSSAEAMVALIGRSPLRISQSCFCVMHIALAKSVVSMLRSSNSLWSMLPGEMGAQGVRLERSFFVTIVLFVNFYQVDNDAVVFFSENEAFHMAVEESHAALARELVFEFFVM